LAESQLATLFAACPEVGQFPDAIRFGEAALRHSSGKERASLEEQLKSFREQHPWRMKPAHAAGDSIPTHTVE
jgi:hypothetical protein